MWPCWSAGGEIADEQHHYRNDWHHQHILICRRAALQLTKADRRSMMAQALDLWVESNIGLMDEGGDRSISPQAVARSSVLVGGCEHGATVIHRLASG